MKMFNGYIDGNTVLVNQDLQGYDGMKVIITVMDETIEKSSQGYTMKLPGKKQAALDETFGIWASHRS